jgi:hypothetical protein
LTTLPVADVPEEVGVVVVVVVDGVVVVAGSVVVVVVEGLCLTVLGEVVVGRGVVVVAGSVVGLVVEGLCVTVLGEVVVDRGTVVELSGANVVAGTVVVVPEPAAPGGPEEVGVGVLPGSEADGSASDDPRPSATGFVR